MPDESEFDDGDDDALPDLEVNFTLNQEEDPDDEDEEDDD